MKTLGLLGGMSWESTSEYYRIINKEIQSRLGGLHSASCIIHSFNFAEIALLQQKGEWKALEKILISGAHKLEEAGAEAVILCTNTMHKLAEAVESSINVPFIHIADAAAEAVQKSNLQTVGLTGTFFTMQETFYRDRLKTYGIKTLVPSEQEQELLHKIIFEELCLGIMKETSKEACLDIFLNLENRGAQGIILGCTELPLLLRPEDTRLMLFDTTRLHAEKAAVFSLKDRLINLD
ncbi:aspartate/glutamate racemase family protein [Alkalicoccus saliphilus]|uniref:Aspartate racemase n=1 Tax=Alkalicoccus saliphilus TaxID=200989 RepID=A0A2T4U4F8_9BACI|nr:aspartate/glutamate racemase family protein [Alkalicoccus saliphilus]PTL38274.1 aspartate racemase [Alkalicoccus saliphilus]